MVIVVLTMENLLIHHNGNDDYLNFHCNGNEEEF